MSTDIEYISEPARSIPVCHEADLCVVGGSCTGVFAAARAAQLGLSVAVLEQGWLLGGMATAAQVNEWHSTWDVSGERRIIGGLTLEMMARLRRRGAVLYRSPIRRGEFRFNSAELAGELEELVRERGIRVFLGARCVGAASEGGRVGAAIIEDRSGRRAVRARFFIDATGDGTLLAAAGFPLRRPAALQPVNAQALVAGLAKSDKQALWDGMRERLAERGYPAANGAPWHFEYPGSPELRNLFGARIHGYDTATADDYTAALLEGRRLHRIYLDLAREQFSPGLSAPVVVAWAQALGVRQTRHAQGLYQVSGSDLLSGRRFADAIAQGTYPLDVHSPEGTRLRYLDGREELVARSGEVSWGRWREESEDVPSFYTLPYRSLVPCGSRNVLAAGRLLDADPEAFGGARVMVNLNQTGEAAGVASALALRHGLDAPEVDSRELRSTLNRHGSLLCP